MFAHRFQQFTLTLGLKSVSSSVLAGQVKPHDLFVLNMYPFITPLDLHPLVALKLFFLMQVVTSVPAEFLFLCLVFFLLAHLS